MKYFGVPTCPYCKKRVNLIRTWSLKRQGEYRCPRCGGISNIYLSPLVYVFALLAIFSAGALYFFRKFVLDDITLKTLLEVVIPFAAFFLLSLFMVYLEKPVIKTVSRAELEQKKRGRTNFESRRAPASAGQNSQMFYDADEYIPKTEYRTGPLPPVPGRVTQDEMAKTSVVDVSKGVQTQRQVRQTEPVRQTAPVRQRAPQEEPPTRRAEEAPVARRSATVRPDAPARQAPQQTASAVQQVARQQVASQQTGNRNAAQPRSTQTVSVPTAANVRSVNVPTTGVTAPTAGAAGVGQRSDGSRPLPSRGAGGGSPLPTAGEPTAANIRSVNVPTTGVTAPTAGVPTAGAAGAGDDFFSKYDDPAYVERRLKELNEKKNRS